MVMESLKNGRKWLKILEKILLLLNHWANQAETWQGCSFGEALQKLLKEFYFIKNSCFHGNRKSEKRPKMAEIIRKKIFSS